MGPRVNERIRAPRVRVIDGATGAQLGIMSASEALQLARQRGLDLVEIAAQAQPPVCKIIDFGKWKYEQAKHEKERKKTQSHSKVKELKLRVGIDPHDYKIKLTHAEDFLMHSDKVRFVLQFRGRQIAHPELGMEMMHRVIADLKGVGQPDAMPRMTGKVITMTLSPLPAHQRVRKFRPQDAVVDIEKIRAAHEEQAQKEAEEAAEEAESHEAGSGSSDASLQPSPTSA